MKILKTYENFIFDQETKRKHDIAESDVHEDNEELKEVNKDSDENQNISSDPNK